MASFNRCYVNYSRVRATCICVSILVLLLAAGMAIEPALGDHDEPDDDAEIIEVQSLTMDGTDTGEVVVELSYHLADDIGEFEVTFVDAGIEITDLAGFEQTGDETYAWDETHSQPSITLTRQTNLSVSPYSGMDYVQTTDWALVGTVSTNLAFTAVDPETIDRSIYVTSDDQDTIEGQTMVYFGEYEKSAFSSAEEEFTIVDTTDGAAWWSLEELEEIMGDSSEMLDVGGVDGEVTIFIVDDPIRGGGLASGEAADFWIHQGSLTPGHTTLWHEYVHTRQVDRLADSARWTHEAEAEYFAYLLALKQGEIDFHAMHSLFDSTTEEYDDVVLTDRHSWAGTRADYELGALALANLDMLIRKATDGERTYEDVLAAKNQFEGEIDAADFQSKVESVAGTSMEDFFAANLDSTPESLEIPPPTIYDGNDDAASLNIAASDGTAEPGDTAHLTFEITNTGEDDSLAPTLEVDGPDAFERGNLSLDEHAAGVSKLSEAGDAIVFDTLEPGDTVVFEYEVIIPDSASFDTYGFSATLSDLGGSVSSDTAELLLTETPDAALDGPDTAILGDEVTFDAGDSTADSGTLSYAWTIEGPIETVTDATSDPTFEWTFDEPGKYAVTLEAENEAGGVDVAQHELIVTDPPSVSIDAPDHVEVNATVFLNASVTNEVGEYDVTWTIGTDELTGESIQLTLRGHGVHEVEVEVMDEYGASTTETLEITSGDGQQADDTGNGDDLLDAVGPGFGPAVAIVALLGLLAARARTLK